MHATIEQLLEIRDGLQNELSLHVDSCSRCQAELSELNLLREQMFETANQKPSTELWQRITRSVEMQAADALSPAARNAEVAVPVELLVAQQQQVQQFTSLSKAVYSLAASILVTGCIGLFLFAPQNQSQSQNQLLQANIQELMLNSRGMERSLQKVALQNELLTVSERSVADRLYWRLAYLDQKIQDNNIDSNNFDSNDGRIEALWNNRIDALTELNQLYYQRQQTLNDSEI